MYLIYSKQLLLTKANKEWKTMQWVKPLFIDLSKTFVTYPNPWPDKLDNKALLI